MYRLTIDLTEQQHQNLKGSATVQGKTLKQYVIEQLFATDAGEDSAWQELRAILGQRVAEGMAGRVSAQSIDAIVDEELGSRHLDT